MENFKIEEFEYIGDVMICPIKSGDSHPDVPLFLKVVHGLKIFVVEIDGEYKSVTVLPKDSWTRLVAGVDTLICHFTGRTSHYNVAIPEHLLE